MGCGWRGAGFRGVGCEGGRAGCGLVGEVGRAFVVGMSRPLAFGGGRGRAVV